MLVTAACSGDGRTTVDSANGELDEPRRMGPEYKPAPVTAAGTITGTVAVGGANGATAAATASPPNGQAAPAAPAAPTAAPSVAGTCAAPAASSFAVFLEDIATGLPLPGDAVRRHELAVGPCELTPTVSIATANATLNLSNSLGRVHHVAFTFDGMKNPMLRVPFSDPGQLVPSESVLAVPGVVDVTSDQHPSTRARIVVLEHPYGVLTTDGRFTLDSVPPGEYSLVALSATGRAEAKVQVKAGATTNVTLQLSPQ